MKAKDFVNSKKTAEQELKNQAIEQLRAYLSEYDIKLTRCKLKYLEAGNYEISFEFVKNNFSQTETFLWDFDEELETVGEHIKKQVLYIAELREKFPEYAVLNDYIQAHRKFEKTISLYDEYSNSTATVRAELTSYLKLPNETSCGFGGGDYQIKKTPKRVEIFKNNINTLINCFLDYIAELRGVAKGLDELEKQLNKKD